MIEVRVIDAHKGSSEQWVEMIPETTTLQSLLNRPNIVKKFGERLSLEVGVWGKRQSMQYILQDKDQVEFYRPLTIDPKEARRIRNERAKKRAKSA